MMEKEVYFGYILKADLRGALDYLGQDPAQSDLYAKYMAIFDREEYLSYGLGKDLETYSGLSSAELEYRAKLVELIYSTERNLLISFAQEADDSAPDNGHSLAAYRIVCDFSEMLRCDHFTGLEIGSIQKTALELYQRDCELRQ